MVGRPAHSWIDCEFAIILSLLSRVASAVHSDTTVCRGDTDADVRLKVTVSGPAPPVLSHPCPSLIYFCLACIVYLLSLCLLGVVSLSFFLSLSLSLVLSISCLSMLLVVGYARDAGAFA